MPIKIFFSLIFGIILFATIDRYFYKQNDSFCLKEMIPKWSIHPENDGMFNERIQEILDQPFIYLTKGKQCFVFLSQDQKWVLKFPRLSRKHMKLSLRSIGDISFAEKAKQEQKIYELIQEETKIAYTHWKPTYNLGHVYLVDLMGNSYYFSLNEIPFYLQEYGDQFFSSFWKSSNPKKIIKKTLKLFENLYEKNLIDNDPIFDTNFGIIGETPYIIDPGEYQFCQQLPLKEQYLRQMTHSLGSKLQERSPNLFLFYKNLLQTNASQIK